MWAWSHPCTPCSHLVPCLAPQATPTHRPIDVAMDVARSRECMSPEASLLGRGVASLPLPFLHELAHGLELELGGAERGVVSKLLEHAHQLKTATTAAISEFTFTSYRLFPQEFVCAATNKIHRQLWPKSMLWLWPHSPQHSMTKTRASVILHSTIPQNTTVR